MNKGSYVPQPMDTSDVQLPQELNELVEKMARNVHEVWAQSRISQGWTYGPERNDALNDQLKGQESQLAAIRQEQARAGSQELDIDAIRRELDKELSFEEGINTALVATILDKIVVRKDSTKDEIHLDIYLKLGHRFEAQYSPETASASINSPKNTMPTHRIKRI